LGGIAALRRQKPKISFNCTRSGRALDKTNSKDIQMPPQFGTSGLRGLVSDLTPALVGDYTRAFIAACPMGAGLFVARDLRASSPDIAAAVLAAAKAEGISVTDCGAAPTPALALAAMQAGAAAIMVTGSHIPADRNGLKFYTPTGEITKTDETQILQSLGRAPAQKGQGTVRSMDANMPYAARYRSAFGAVLGGLRLGIYAHSAVGRDLMAALLADMGAEVVMLGRADHFIPVDTEAVDAATRQQLARWASADHLDAILSTDGDGDRPLMTDETGTVIPGDVMGQITARYLGARHVATPVSSNTGVLQGGFAELRQTRIGSPYVIAAMAELGGAVVGYEANGGFLLGFDAKGPAGALPALMTRDAMLPMLALLTAAKGTGLSRLVAAEPARFTAADRLQEVPTAKSQAFVAKLRNDPQARAGLLARLNLTEAALDLTDGLRITTSDGAILHLRPSGNAPELRLYIEAETKQRAEALLTSGLQEVAGLVK
jgi:phosphomannomutase